METKNKVNETEMQEFVNNNISIVPKNQVKKVNAMSLKDQYLKVKFYIDIQKLREDAKIKNSVPNKVKEMMEKRGTVADAKKVIEYCQSFVDGYREKEIAKIDEKIRQLEIAKQLL